ncbi:MAG: nucleotidyltransferase family protein [Emcibacter sp.]|nr:nucleotidyltransferase family protein [Emcibacter sp.]
MSRSSLLLQVLKDPDRMLKLTVKDWNSVLFAAHMLKLRGRLASDAWGNGLWEQLPHKAQQILTSARIIAEARQRKVMWEVNRLRRALFSFEDKVILVKGGAYIARGLRAAKGRISVDIDILVAKKNLDIVENHLLLSGYASQVLNSYDQQYYREWAHELPPLVHPDRMVEVDVHHNILQVTNRLCPNINLMIEAAVPLEDNIYVLSDVDMLLHSIVHLFVDGTIKASLRNLLEQHDLISEFSQQVDFWTQFMDRAEELGFGRPVFYCLHYCAHFLNTDIPLEVMTRAKKAAPGFLALKIMDMMIFRTMVPYGTGGSKVTDYLATNGLYIRSHWLRMPPALLAKHLTRKFFRRFLKG